jgi:hypothetical protein
MPFNWLKKVSMPGRCKHAPLMYALVPICWLFHSTCADQHAHMIVHTHARFHSFLSSCLYTHARTHTHTHINTHTHVCISFMNVHFHNTYIHSTDMKLKLRHTHTSAHVVYSRVYWQMRVYVCMYVCVHVCMYVCINVCMYDDQCKGLCMPCIYSQNA